MASQEFLSILSSYRGKLEGVRTFLEDLRVLRKKKEDGEDILGDLTALEGAQVQLALAFAASSLFFSELSLLGNQERTSMQRRKFFCVESRMVW